MIGERLVTLERRQAASEVIVVTSGWPHDGHGSYGIFSERQVRALEACGVSCDVLFIHGYRSKLAYPIAAFRLARLCRQRRYTLIHAHGGEAGLAACFTRRAPVLTSYLGSDLLGAARSDGSVSLSARVRRSLIRASARFFAATTTQSREMEDVLPDAARAKNTVVPTGVDPQLFRQIDRTEARRRLGWNGVARIALFASNPTVPCKRYWLAESAVSLAQKALPSLTLQVLRNVEPSEVPVAMSAADCLLFTSAREGSPNVVKEALMCDLPVVSTRVGDVAETLQNVTPSYVCDNRPETIAAALVECLTTPVRSNGRATSAGLSAHAISERVIRKYEEVSGRPLRRTHHA